MAQLLNRSFRAYSNLCDAIFDYTLCHLALYPGKAAGDQPPVVPLLPGLLPPVYRDDP